MSEHLVVCQFCAACCGLALEIEDDQVIRVGGDAGHPLSRGYTCPKGRAIGAFHHHPRRLDRPRVHGVEVGWDECLADLGAGLRRIVDAHGPNAVGNYAGTGGYTDTAGRAAEMSFFKQLDTVQLYTAATVDVVPAWRATEFVTGFASELRPDWFPNAEAPRVAVLLGTNPIVSHGYYGLKIPDPVRWLREYKGSGGELWVLDPRRTETAQLANHHLALRPGSDAVVLAWLARELLVDGADWAELDAHTAPADLARLETALAPFSLELAVECSGIEPEQLGALLEAIRGAGHIAMSPGTGITFGPHALLTEWLRWVVLIVTGSLDNPGGMRFDPGWLEVLEERPAWKPAPEGHQRAGPASRPDVPQWFDQPPCVVLVDEIEAGNLKALFITGGNPVTAMPDPERTTAALASLDMLVVLDVVDNDLAGLATHVLPVAGPLERSDVTVAAGRTAYSPAVVTRGPERRQTWWIYGHLAHVFGIDVLGGLDPDACTDDLLLGRLMRSSRGSLEELIEAGPRGVASPPLYGWVHDKVLADGCWRIAPATLIARLGDLLGEPRPGRVVLVSGRDMRNTNSVRYGRLSQPDEPPSLRIHPEDADAAGVIDGQRVEVTSDDGAVVAVTRTDPRLRVGVVSLTHGSVRTNVTRLGSRDVDPLTSQPTMTAIPVTIVPA